MRKLSGLALRGLAVALPFALTIYFVYWSVTRIAWLVEEALHVVGLGAFYLPGVGIAIFFGALLMLGLIAGVLGFSGIAGAATNIAQILFFVFLVLLVVSAIARAVRGRPPM